MRHLGLKAYISALSVAVLAGCHCGNSPPAATLSVAFVHPTNGQVLTAADNTEPTVGGFHYNVVVAATASDGKPVTLAGATLSVGADAGTNGPTATLSGAGATFTNTSLQGLTNVLSVLVTDSTGRQATAKVTVTVGSTTQTVTITQPASGATLNASNDADPNAAGYQVGFTVTTTGLSGDQGILVCPEVCGIPPTSFTVGSSGSASFNITLTEPACAQTQVTCTATVTDAASVQHNSAAVTFSLKTVAPEIAVSAPLGSSSTVTFPVQAVVTCAADGSNASLARTGVAPLSATVQSGVVTFPSVTVPSDGTYAFTLTVTDEGGNTASANVPVVVRSSPPVVSLSVAGADGGVVNQLPTQALVTLDSEPIGTEVELWVTVSGALGQPYRVNTVSSAGHNQSTFPLDLAEGANTLKVCAANAAGASTCITQQVTVSTGQPACHIVSPADNAILGGTGVVSVGVEGVAGAVTVSAMQGTNIVGTGTNTIVGAGQANVSITLPADGLYTLVASCGGGTGTSQTLPVKLDRAAPVLTANVRGDTVGQGNLGPTIVDTSPLPGMQIIEDVVTKPYATVSVTGCAMVSGQVGQADGNGQLALRDITVPPFGTCTLTFVSTDLVGNTTTLQRVLTLAFSPGSLTIASPVPGSTLTAGPDGGTGTGLTTSVTLNFSNPNGSGTLTLYVNGTQVSQQGVTSADSSKVLTNIQLSEGANALRATLTDASGVTACAVGVVYVNTQAPGSIVLVSPNSGSLNLSNDSDANTPGIQSVLRYAANPKSATHSVDLCTNISVGPTSLPCIDGSGWFTLASDVATFVPSFTYPDGVYSLKAVLNDNGAISASPAVSLTVDSVRPKVLSVSIPADTNGDGVLSYSELQVLAGASPKAVVTVQNLDINGSAKLTDANTGAVYGPSVGATGGNTATITFTLPAAPLATYSLVVDLTRSSGNPNQVGAGTALDPRNTAAFVSLGVDNDLPPVTITGPTKQVLGIADDADPVLAGYQIVITALIPDPDVQASGISISLPPGVSAAGPLTYSGGTASQKFTLSQTTGTQQYAFTVQAADRYGNVGTQGITLTAVLSPPVISIGSPTTVTVYSSHSVPMSAGVVGYGVINQLVTVTDQIGTGTPTTLGTMQVAANGTATGTFTLANAINHTISMSLVDGAGNVSAPTSVSPVNVTAPGCTIELTHPSTTPVYFGQADDLNSGLAGLQYQVSGTSPDCHGVTATLCSGSSCTGSNTLDTQVASAATGNFTFNTITLADPSTTQQLTVSMNNGVASSTSFTYSVKLSPPVLSAIQPSQSTLYYVAASNVNLLKLPQTPGYIADLVGGPPYNNFATANLSFQVAGGIGSNGASGTATLTYGSTTLGTTSITTDPQTIQFNGFQLPQHSSGTLKITVTDPASNVASNSASVAAVDVIPPAAPVLSGGGGDAGFITDARSASVALTWTASGDDGTVGTPQGYDLRWSTGVVLPNGISNDTDYFDPTKTLQVTGALLPATQVLPYSVTALPPLNSYSVAVRAVDAVGNYSVFQAPTRVDNLWTEATFASPDTTPYFGYVLAANGDFDGDGFDDLVVSSSQAGGNPGPGYLYVYYGQSNFSATTPVKVTAVAPVAGENFGGDTAIGDVGYFTAVTEKRPDLLAGAKYYSASRGRAFLYFGQQGSRFGATPTVVEFRGRAATAGRFGYDVAIINDINGDGLDEVLISAPLEGTGNVYLFYGRQVSAWTALATATDATDTGCAGAPCPYIPVTAADRVFTSVAPISQYGRVKAASLGDITGDGVNDFTIPAVVTGDVLVFSGATVNAAGAGGTVPSSSALQVLGPSAGLGYASFGGLGNLVGGAGMDLAVSNQAAGSVYLYADGTATGFASTPPYPLVLSRPGVSGFGFNMTPGDLNGDSAPDLVVGENVTGTGSAWVFYHHPSGTEFDLNPGAGFAQSRLQDLAVPNSNLGISVAVGDFNGDGKPDLAAGESVGSIVSAWY